MICRSLKALEVKQKTPPQDAPTAKVRILTNDSDLSPLIDKDNSNPTATAATTTGTTCQAKAKTDSADRVRCPATLCQEEAQV